MEPYETYKDSGIEWIGEIPVGWEVKKLKYVLTEHSGNGFPDKEQGNKNSSIPFYKVSDINGKDIYINTSNNYVESEVAKKHNWNIVPKHSIITAKIGEALRKNHRKISLVDCIIDNNCIALEAKTIDYKFNYYLLSLIDFSWFVNPGAVPSLSVDKFKSFIAPIPNTDEQTAIANYLDRKTAEIDALIAQKERLLELYEEEKTAIINHAVTKGIDPNAELKDSGVEWIGEILVGWEIKKLKHGVSKVGSGVTPRGGASTYQLSGIPLLRSQNIHVDGIKMDDVAYIDEKIHDSMSNSKVQTGDVLLNITGASIGRCFYVDENFDYHQRQANVNQHVCIIRPNDKIKTAYLYFVFRSDLGKTQINVEQTGSGREGLNFEALNNFIIPYFSVEEQTAIVNYLDRKTAEINAKIARTQRIIELQKEYRTTLISEVVTGKIKVSHLATEEVKQ